MTCPDAIEREETFLEIIGNTRFNLSNGTLDIQLKLHEVFASFLLSITGTTPTRILNCEGLNFFKVFI